MIYSLQHRLLLGMAIVVGIVGMLGGVIAYDWAFDEAIEAQDTVLTQMAAIAALTKFDQDHPVAGGDIESQVTISELGDKPSSPHARAMWSITDGLHDFGADAQKSRLMMRTRSDGSRFVVTQPTAIRDEVARDSAIHALIPFAGLFPCLTFVFAVVVSRSLRPMKELAAELDARNASDMTSISIDGTPEELRPFIRSINSLFGRVKQMMDRQRQFIADAAHELRTPVTALNLQAENLEQATLSADGKLRLSRLREGAGRMAHLLDQLLMLARFDGSEQVADFGIVSVDTCVKQVVADLMPLAADRGVDLGFDVIEAIEIESDSSMLSIVVRNLVDNAVRAVPRGGQVNVSVCRQNDAVCISVVDNGPGIPDVDLTRIFDPFFRGSQPSSSDGVGLGLAIVRRVADRLGARVILHNRPDSQCSGLKAALLLPPSSHMSGENSAGG